MNNEITNLDEELDQDILDIINRHRQEQEESKDYYSFCSDELLEYSLKGLSSIHD